jgi:crotonobetainyl-CoA:carnitine CoA-transferase CaiB-like acyl-CoA transferase
MIDLSGYRVVEIGTAVSMPLCSAVLANLGAEVIKIESKQKLDGNRIRIPKKDAAGPLGTMETFPLLHDLNPGKKSVTVNLKTEAGRAIFVELIKKADIFIQNFAPGWLERLDLGPEALAAINPRLIMMFASGYGQEGPLSPTRVYATIMSGIGGLEGLVGEENGDVAGLVATAFGDPNSAYFGVLEVMSAIYARETSGKGCLIDLSQIEAIATVLGEAIVEWQASGRVPGPVGNRSRWAAPHGIYPSAGDDRWVAVSVASEEEWRSLAALVESDGGSWVKDERFADMNGRLQHREELDRHLAQWTGRYQNHDLSSRLQASGVRASPVLTIDELETDAHTVAREFLQQVEHPALGAMQITSTPWRFDGVRPKVHGVGPMLGSANRDVLERLLGLPADEIERLERDGVLA